MNNRRIKQYISFTGMAIGWWLILTTIIAGINTLDGETMKSCFLAAAPWTAVIFIGGCLIIGPSSIESIMD